MEIALLLVFALAAALKMGESYAQFRPRLQPAAAVPQDSDDGFVTLGPPPRRSWSETASSAEMTFAGQFLHLVGLLLLTGGALNYLRLSGISQAATSGGWLQSLTGGGLGIFLCWSAERAFQRGMRSYAQPFLAGGSALMLLTAGAAHFHFHLLGAPLFALLTFSVVAWSGWAALRHDAPGIAACMVGALFAGPLAMTFPLSHLGSVLAYLLAVNLAVTAVAYRMRWDAFLIASFAGTYGLYFHSFGLAHPGVTLAFLLATYALFLVSGTLFHLLRGSAGSVDLTMSLVNPLLFAYASYATLLRLPAGAAVLTYALIGGVHLLLSAQANRLSYARIRWTHLALAIFYSTAGISFLMFCTYDARYFGLVTLLWLLQGFALLWVSNRLEERSVILTRRASYLNMMLALYQLMVVVPWMEQPAWVELPGALAFLTYFWFHETRARTSEEHAFSNLALVGALAALNHALIADVTALLAGTALSPLLMLAYRRFPRTLRYYRSAACGLGVLMTVLVIHYPWGVNWQLAMLPMLAILLFSLSLFAKPDSLESPLGPFLSAVVLLRFCYAVGHWNLSVGVLLANLVALALLARGRSWPRLYPAALVGTAGLVLISLALPVPALPLALVYGLGCRSCPVLAVPLFLKGSLELSAGAPGTLLWCLLALAYPRPTTARVVFFLAFLKAVCWDTTPSPAMLAIIPAFALAARRSDSAEWRNFHILEGLLVFAFQTSALLYRTFGILDSFQVLISGFWACASLLFVCLGIHLGIKLLRLFGLVVLVSCLIKMYAVDVAVLDAYSQTTVTFGLGILLMVTSFFYQCNRGKLQVV